VEILERLGWNIAGLAIRFFKYQKEKSEEMAVNKAYNIK
jgi:hypothetical protein